MKTTRITIKWPHGIHLRAATRLVRLAQSFRSSIHLRLGAHIADARSVLSILILTAGLGTALDIEASGHDEHEALQAVEEFFAEDADQVTGTPPDPSEGATR